MTTLVNLAQRKIRRYVCLTCLEDFLQVGPEPVHDEEPVLLALDQVAAAAAVTRHSEGREAPERWTGEK